MKEHNFIDGMLAGVPIFDSVIIRGKTIAATPAGTTNPIRALLYDEAGKVLMATGLEVPADTAAIYAKGALFIDTDVGTGTSGLYVNVGTAASCVFKLVTNAS